MGNSNMINIAPPTKMLNAQQVKKHVTYIDFHGIVIERNQ